MRSILDESLVDILSYCAVRDLPKEDDGENVWIKAIALVAKSDGSKNYAAVEKDENGNNKIVLDTGKMASIVKIEAIYPYLFLDANYLPSFKRNTKEDRIKWLKYNGVEKDLSKLTLDELNREILLVAMMKNLHALKQK